MNLNSCPVCKQQQQNQDRKFCKYCSTYLGDPNSESLEYWRNQMYEGQWLLFNLHLKKIKHFNVEKEQLEKKIETQEQELIELRVKVKSLSSTQEEVSNDEFFHQKSGFDALTGQEVETTSYKLLNSLADQHEGNEELVMGSETETSSLQEYDSEHQKHLQENGLKDYVKKDDLDSYIIEQFQSLVKPLEQEVQSLKERLQSLPEKQIRQLEPSNSTPQTDTTLSKNVEVQNIEDDLQPLTDSDDEPEVNLSEEEKNLVSFYNSGQDLSQYIIPVSETEESQANRRGGEKNIFFERDRRGSYCLMSFDETGSKLALVPKPKLNINQYNIVSAEVFFECRDFRQRVGMRFELLKPGKVSKAEDNQDVWKLDERGILKFF